MKSLYEYIVQAIDEALPEGSAVNGRQIYDTGFWRYQRAYFGEREAEAKRELERTKND